MKILFCVQGEGRGHMTQAIALKKMLENNGHEVIGLVLGTKDHREVPAYFKEAFPMEIQYIESPHFIFNQNKSISTFKTGLHFLTHIPQFIKSIHEIKNAVRRLRPQLIVNFYEPIAGLFKRFYPQSVPSIAIGHQYMLEHPGYVKNERYFFQRRLMQIFNRMIGSNSLRVALSFYSAVDLPDKDIFICPPILREELFFQAETSQENFALVYLLNRGYADELIQWHQENPEQEIHCFCDQPELINRNGYQKTLQFHALDADKFMDGLRRCRAVVCTAGFETVSEAAWLGKPILMVPVENHVEQELNAIDAQNSKFGIFANQFNLNLVLNSDLKLNHESFRQWVDQAECKILELVNRAGKNFVEKPS